MDDDDDDLWGPPFVVKDDTFRKQTLRGCEFWFDYRTDVLEENFQNEWYCELVWRLLNEKKQDVVVIVELDKDPLSLQNDTASSGSGDSQHPTGSSSDSDKTLSVVLPDAADTSSSKSVLDEDENTSSVSDAQTVVTTETRDSSNDTEEIEPEARLKPQETAANDPLIAEVAEDADTSSSPVLASKIEEAEEHSCSSLVTEFDPVKQAPDSKSSSSISRESIGGSTLKPLLLETSEKVREKSNETNEDGEVLKDHQQSDSSQDIVTVSEPFTTESLLEMCDEPDKGKEIPRDARSKKSHPGAVKTAVKDELIINLLTEARKKTEGNALLNPGSVLNKKRQRQSNSSGNRNIKQKVQGKAGKINSDPVKKSAQSTPGNIRGPSVPTERVDSLLDSKDGGHIVSDSVKSLSISELKNKTGKELRSIAKELKVTHYYKLKKEDLLERLTYHLNLQLTDCTKQRMDS
ncbi:PREDICTED: uncharacterized protein LOC104782647 [Camelina sativa]|uniref:Uncharacterized protein LOC104782647 n=1 Tax=Camelina sativa TaxID=90675 RepID=A0ABM0YU74_CAMSA|nr:PREDICTED: uncharacterized protein LOC104782647 [Camelina sativa]